ncbi:MULTISPECIES: hypothetical protein [unclassified Janthinobacterium]|uniref:hypothetical protein n=1 Tax=unclassified Janthinobacterium TaxID=2610881 RepID=UPI0018C9EF77|nr:hypothetical protein [Janthinobacterium sp. CG_23.4]MDH6159725.1 hypothetical protein [Janthinobacterium sp. CG_23.4]
MDQHKLRSHVFDKTGIKIDVDDPIFALVALNEAVLAETVERQLALLDAATQALAAQARAAGGLPPLPAAAMAQPTAELELPVSAPVSAPSPAGPAGFTPREWRLLGAAAIVSLACALLVLGGAALLYKP